MWVWNALLICAKTQIWFAYKKCNWMYCNFILYMSESTWSMFFSWNERLKGVLGWSCEKQLSHHLFFKLSIFKTLSVWLPEHSVFLRIYDAYPLFLNESRSLAGETCGETIKTFLEFFPFPSSLSSWWSRWGLTINITSRTLFSLVNRRKDSE